MKKTQFFHNMLKAVRPENHPLIYWMKNKLVLLSIIDIVIIFWMAWYESHIQYESLLEVEYDVLSKMGLPTIPLNETIYNTIIIAIVVNIIVLIIESLKRDNRKYQRVDFAIVLIYFFLIMSCMLWGGIYISSRMQSGIINEYNPLFRFPIWVVGKELFTKAFTVTRIYVSLCIIHECVCFSYLYLCINKYNSKD